VQVVYRDEDRVRVVVVWAERDRDTGSDALDRVGPRRPRACLTVVNNTYLQGDAQRHARTRAVADVERLVATARRRGVYGALVAGTLRVIAVAEVGVLRRERGRCKGESEGDEGVHDRKRDRRGCVDALLD
jgi:hypothetical protein